MPHANEPLQYLKGEYQSIDDQEVHHPDDNNPLSQLKELED